MLITYAMTLDLQETTGRYARSLHAIREDLGPASLAFFAPLSTPGDAAVDGSVSAPAPIPPPSELDLRQRAADAPAATAGMRVRRGGPWEDRETPGSNSFAVAGSLAEGGGAIVANDMHLHLAVPNTWYRISLRWPGHEETGVTVPGAPVMVAGSTGKIAWGFTVAYAGTGDVIIVSPSISPEMYHGPNGGGLVPYEKRTETVAVRGAKPVEMDFEWTVWGPVVGDAPNGRQLVYHWTGDDPAAANLDILDLEDAKDAAGAVATAHHMGVPALNFLVADSAGRIAWTVAGILPKRVGYDGRLPVSWAFGDRRWDSYLGTGGTSPQSSREKGGVLWTANNRIVGGKSAEALGDAGYEIPARARQIRDDIGALARGPRPIETRDLLAVQLDDRALMLETWHTLLLGVLRPEVVSRKASRGDAA